MTAPGTWQPGGHPADVNAILTSGLACACHYAAVRPDCQALASIRYGQIALCARCDQRRSSLGKGTPPLRLPDPHVLLEVAAARVARAGPAHPPARPGSRARPGPAAPAPSPVRPCHTYTLASAMIVMTRSSYVK